jgi:hypothetical protein
MAKLKKVYLSMRSKTFVKPKDIVEVKAASVKPIDYGGR